MRSFRLAVVMATVTVPALLLPPEESEAALAERYSAEQYPSVPDAVFTLTHPLDGAAKIVTIAPCGIVVSTAEPVPAA